MVVHEPTIKKPTNPFRSSTIVSIILVLLCNVWAQNALQKGKNLFYFEKEKNESRCTFSYVDSMVYNVDLHIDGKNCKQAGCDIDLIGLYNRQPTTKCLESSVTEAKLKFNESNFVPICDFVKYHKSLDKRNASGFLSYTREGLCLYKVVDNINVFSSDYKYKFGVLKIEKDSNLGYVAKNRNGAYCKQGECEMDIVFHSCDANTCRFSIAQLGFLLDSSFKVNVTPLCDFVKIDLSFEPGNMSLGSITATHSGTCDLRIRNNKMNRVISIDVPAKVIDLPKSSRTYLILE